jgi:aryl-alcohol dehydrogenase-like predicted oxidoreductase
MKKVTLGRSGLEVSRIAYGGGPLGGGMGPFDEERGIASVRRALERGINFFDTGRIYGRSEELLGKALAPELRSDRDSIVIATKGGTQVSGSPNPGDPGVTRNGSPEAIRADLETSLTTLGVDHIDLYQIHWPDPAVPLAETAGVLGELRDEGKIRAIGVSNFSAAQMAEFERGAPVQTLQPGYSMFNRLPESDELPYAAEHDIGVLVYGPLAHGILSGSKFDPAQTFGDFDWRRNHGFFQPDTMAANLRVVADLEAFAEARGYTVSQLAIAWVLAQGPVHVAILGTGKAEHVDAALAADDIELSPDDLAEIEGILQGAVAVPFFNLEDM